MTVGRYLHTVHTKRTRRTQRTHHRTKSLRVRHPSVVHVRFKWHRDNMGLSDQGCTGPTPSKQNPCFPKSNGTWPIQIQLQPNLIQMITRKLVSYLGDHRLKLSQSMENSDLAQEHSFPPKNKIIQILRARVDSR